VPQILRFILLILALYKFIYLPFSLTVLPVTSFQAILTIRETGVHRITCMSHVTAAYFFRLVVRAGDVPPLFNDSAQVDAVEWNVHLTDLIVL